MPRWFPFIVCDSENLLFIPQPPRDEFVQDFLSSPSRSLYISSSPADRGLGTANRVPLYSHLFGILRKFIKLYFNHYRELKISYKFIYCLFYRIFFEPLPNVKKTTTQNETSNRGYISNGQCRLTLF